MWTKIKNWIKDNIPILATVGLLFAGLFYRLCSSKRRGLEVDKQLCESAENRITEATESIERATERVDAAEGVVERLEQSIESSEDRVDDCSNTVEDLIRDTDNIASILDKYNKGIEQPKND